MDVERDVRVVHVLEVVSKSFVLKLILEIVNISEYFSISRTFDIRGRRDISLKFFGSNLDPFLNSGFSLATLQESGTVDS